jgi:hypothetical protein
MTQTSHAALTPHATHPVAIYSKSDNYEGHFVLQAEKNFPLYLVTRFREVAQTSHLEITPHSPQALQVWAKSGSNEGNLTSLGRLY